MRRNRTVLAVLTSLLLAAGVVTAPAAVAADGDCSGSFVDKAPGTWIPCKNPPFPDQFDYWHNNGTTSDPTALHLVNCKSNPDITLFYWHENISTWVSQGTKRFWCLNTDSGWQFWDYRGSGYYHLEITNPRSSDGLLDVGYFHAAW